MCKLIFPHDNYIFDTHTQIQNKFIDKINNCGTDEALEWLKTVKCNNECSYPQALSFSWEDTGDTEYIFELSRFTDFSDSYKVTCTKPFLSVCNLRVGEKYFWRVNGSESKCFYTADNIIRFIKIDGAMNVRDVGGNKIRQGLIYRGSDLSTLYKISENGKKVFTDMLKIKTEVELRKECADVTKSSVSDDTTYKWLPYRPYKEIFESEHRKGVCDIMDFLSDERNYPMYIHCLGGADRTGMIALFLRALAGENDDFIHLDYELTSLSTYAYGFGEVGNDNGLRSRNHSYYQEMMTMLDVYAPGKTLHEKVKLFLFECGVTEECIERIKTIICK